MHWLADLENHTAGCIGVSRELKRLKQSISDWLNYDNALI